MTIDVAALLKAGPEVPVVPVMQAMKGSRILAIAGQVRALKAQGQTICDLTVGDFSPAQFRIPKPLEERIVQALHDGQTNYPPASGVPDLQQAVAGFYERELGLRYDPSSVLVASGARPILYACWRLFTEPGDLTIAPVPSWNSGYYAQLCQTNHVLVPTLPQDNFFPTVDALRPHLRAARMLVINSPLNPTGTMIDAEQLRQIVLAVVEENARRRGERPLMLVYDQVYWMLVSGSRAHVNPVALVPESAPYVVHVDAISKSLAATGLRVGWAVLPPAIAGRMGAFIGHVGAWAPRAEQMATAWFLQPEQAAALRAFSQEFGRGIRARLQRLYEGLVALQRDGFPVEAIEPQGAMYLSFRANLLGSGAKGRFSSNEEVRRFLLESAGLAVVPFQAFDLEEESGWFRMSVGAVGEQELDSALSRLRQALLTLR